MTEASPRAARPAGLRHGALPPLRWFDTTIARIAELTPRLRRITLTGPALAGYASAGPDAHLKLVIPQPAGMPAFETTGNLYEQWRALPEEVRPVLRTYTVRAARPEAAELDLDLALHDTDGPGMRWVRTARVGDPCALYGARGEFALPAEADAAVLIADECAAPAAAAIVESLPAGMPIRLFLDVADPADVAPPPRHPSLETTWVRRSAGRPPGIDLVEAVRAAELPGAAPYLWAGAEQGVIALLRTLLRGERGHAAESLELVGYWRRGLPFE